MQRMVGQIGTAQDSPDHKQQLWVYSIFFYELAQ